jgi:hypothetical protein
MIWLRVRDVYAEHDRLAAAGFRILREPVREPWGLTRCGSRTPTAASGVAFWLIEGSTKLQQMRYYPRMGDIEVAAYDLYRADTEHGPVSSPLIDWSWYTAWSRLRGGNYKRDPSVPRRWKEVNDKPGKSPLLFAHVALPHLVAALLGAALFCLGLAGIFRPI